MLILIIVFYLDVLDNSCLILLTIPYGGVDDFKHLLYLIHLLLFLLL